MKKLDDEIVNRFLMGECTEDELRDLNHCLEESPETARELFGHEELYQLGRRREEVEQKRTAIAERRLIERLKIEEIKHNKLHRLRAWTRYAAAFVGVALLSGLSYVYYQTHAQMDELLAVSTQNEIKELMLPDGSKVWLNKHTTLKYPKEFGEDGRKVYMDGEAYFEVEKNPHKPFVVQSDAMQVRVLGTVFNFRSGRTEKSAVATLIEGVIEVKGNHEEGMVVLSPKQKAELNRVTRRLVVKSLDTGIENWHTNEFVFDQADLLTIARTLERSYDVRVILAPNLNGDETYSGTLKRKERVEDVLNLIRNVAPVDYKEVSSGVFLLSKLN